MEYVDQLIDTQQKLINAHKKINALESTITDIKSNKNNSETPSYIDFEYDVRFRGEFWFKGLSLMRKIVDVENIEYFYDTLKLSKEDIQKEQIHKDGIADFYDEIKKSSILDDLIISKTRMFAFMVKDGLFKKLAPYFTNIKYNIEGKSVYANIAISVTTKTNKQFDLKIKFLQIDENEIEN